MLLQALGGIKRQSRLEKEKEKAAAAPRRVPSFMRSTSSFDQMKNQVHLALPQLLTFDICPKFLLVVSTRTAFKLRGQTHKSVYLWVDSMSGQDGMYGL